ncbi:hypothetical protein L1987_06972 [Smallanthus sonchifolius]|uniref:Uncharacterized protein n=1 Tax=Smallanthus sonchifolius TaxID=185202 RepID=A0ACB9JZS0_9ASTR|nr:hypothetical protein L1987_06972 [Smallanthus sonchifolius]
MDIIGDALRQAFMQKHEYESLRDEDKAWSKLQRPILISVFAFITFSIFISTVVSLKIMFPSDPGRRPFCKDLRMQPLSINFSSIATADVGEDRAGGAFYLTDQETVDYYWMVVFVPSAMFFALSSVYLVAGITVSYSAPTRHGCLKVVENNYCASKRGGVRCLSILNLVFGIIFGLLALFLGSTLLTLGSKCSIPLFWCYEITSWGLVILYGGTAFHLRRKAATVLLDETDFANRNLGLEMLEAEFTPGPDVERRVNEGFRSWMGSSYFSSDDDDDDDPQHLSRTSTNSSRQRV